MIIRALKLMRAREGQGRPAPGASSVQPFLALAFSSRQKHETRLACYITWGLSPILDDLGAGRRV